MIEHQNDDATVLTVRCRAQSGAMAILPIIDLSPGGLLVPNKGWDAMPGERVLATFGGLGVRSSQLVWVEDGQAGIAFDEPLHAAVYDQLRDRMAGTYIDLAAEALRREAEEQEKTRPKKRSLA